MIKGVQVRSAGPSFSGLRVAFAAIILSAPAALVAEEPSGHIVISRDLETHYAFLEGTGEATVVDTAPFSAVWADSGMVGVLSDGEAAAITSEVGENVAHALRTDSTNVARRDLSADSTFAIEAGAGAGAGGVGGLVGSAVDSGIDSLHGALGQLQTSLGGDQ